VPCPRRGHACHEGRRRQGTSRYRARLPAAAHVSQRDGYGDDEDAALFFALANALASALATSAGPAHPGAAAAEVLRRFTGSDRMGAGMRQTSFSDALVTADTAAGAQSLPLGREIGALAFDRASRTWQGF